MSNKVETVASCPICDADIALRCDVIVSEIVSCEECGSELEVTELEPLMLEEAPMEEEDWGE